MHRILIFVSIVAGMISCSPARYFTKSQQTLLGDTALAGAHVGISIYDPAVGKYLYNYQGDKYFVPASNTKLFTCYAAMKYLGDSLVAARYRHSEHSIYLEPSGDPTFLHPDFDHQPLFNLIKENGNDILLYHLRELKNMGLAGVGMIMKQIICLNVVPFLFMEIRFQLKEKVRIIKTIP